MFNNSLHGFAFPDDAKHNVIQDPLVTQRLLRVKAIFVSGHFSFLDKITLSDLNWRKELVAMDSSWLFLGDIVGVSGAAVGEVCHRDAFALGKE